MWWIEHALSMLLGAAIILLLWWHRSIHRHERSPYVFYERILTRLDRNYIAITTADANVLAVKQKVETMAVDAATALADLQASMAKVATAVGSVVTQMQTEAQNILDLLAAAKANNTGVDPAAIEQAAQNLNTLGDTANASLASVQGQLNPTTQPAQPATGQAAG